MLVTTCLQLLAAGDAATLPPALLQRTKAEAAAAWPGDRICSLLPILLVTFAPPGGAASFKAHPLVVIKVSVKQGIYGRLLDASLAARDARPW